VIRFSCERNHPILQLPEQPQAIEMWETTIFAMLVFDFQATLWDKELPWINEN
jgi:hypothetical protein